MNKVPYTAPSRLVGATVTAQVGEREISIFHRGTLVLRRPRATTGAPGIDYRHLIDSLLKKPDAFRRYVHHASLFPDVCFRQAYEALKAHDEARADRRYLQLLKLAAEGSETEVSEAIGNLLRENNVPLPDRIEKLLARKARRSVPVTQHMEPLQPALHEYDLLIGMVHP